MLLLPIKKCSFKNPIYMSTKLYLTCFFVALLGQLFTMLCKMIVLNQKAKRAKTNFSPLQYLKDDWLSFLASMIFIFIVLFILSEWLNWKPWVMDYIKSIFVFIGGAGYELGFRLFSVANKRLNKIIDEKSGIADSVKPD